MGLFGITKSELLKRLEDLEYKESNPPKYKVGDKYKSEKFGLGVVTEVEFINTSFLINIQTLNKEYSIAVLIMCLGIAIGVVYSIGMLIKDYLDELTEIANHCENCGADNKHECEYYGCKNDNK